MSGTALTVGQWTELTSAVIKALPRDMSSDEALAWADPSRGEVLRKTLRSALVTPVDVPVSSELLIPIKVTMFAGTQPKPTTKCMSGRRWDYDELDLIFWSPPMQPATPPGLLCVYQVQEKGYNLLEAVAAVLKENHDRDYVLAPLLKERGHLLTLPAVEKLVDEQWCKRRDVGIRPDRPRNFFFVANKEGEAMAIVVYHRDKKWYVGTIQLDAGAIYCKLGVGERVFVYYTDFANL